MKKSFLFCVASTLMISGCQTVSLPPLAVAPKVDIKRYQGLWYEIARYPNSFEKDCVGATARYTLLEDGQVRVINRAFKKQLDGKITQATGKAWVVDTATNAKLKVRFFWPFSGDYWIIDLAEDYSYVVVSEPGRKYLWILYREPFMPDALYQTLLQRLAEKGFDPSRLIRPSQKLQ
ncbi:MAG: lipocalin family protein [Candidatus Sumerlaeota bacterium]|nr:lipocalin family protein [Candidatus Sumerlaeota bacterium]